MPFMGLGVADYSQRSTQHRLNAEFFVSRCVRVEVDKILRHAGVLETHGCCGLERFLEGGWKLFWVEIQKLG
jgi:hypothetical protein